MSPRDPSDSKPTARFAPRDGAVLDLGSLTALAEAPARLVTAWLDAVCPGAPGLVLEGLEPEGEWSPSGPPGARRPSAAQSGITVSPGRAIVVDPGGARHLVTVDEPLRAPWPTSAGPAVRGQLVIVPRLDPFCAAGGVTVAREGLSVRLGFVRPELAGRAGQLPLAASVGNGVDWATDLHRLWQPEHPALTQIARRLSKVEQAVWNAEPEGSVWDRQVLGRSWVRYQTVASSALTAARLDLGSRATTTRDRVRLLGSLYGILRGSVERAATELLQITGSGEGAGPYRAVELEGGGSR